MASSARRSASALAAMPMNSLPRWLISITDMPLPCQSSISAAACRKTDSGSTAGPALKLKTRMKGSERVSEAERRRGEPVILTERPKAGAAPLTRRQLKHDQLARIGGQDLVTARG